jgi:hypothetical protein
MKTDSIMNVMKLSFSLINTPTRLDKKPEIKVRANFRLVLKNRLIMSYNNGIRDKKRPVRRLDVLKRFSKILIRFGFLYPL